MRAVVVMALLLAGCAGGPPVQEEELLDPAKGLLRGVVVDDAIVPLVGAAVFARAGERVIEVSTDVEGRFELRDLEPTLYVLQVEAAGHFPLETTAVVEAGIREPDVVRIVLQRNDREVAFHLQHVWQGRIACATTGANWCALPQIYTGNNLAGDQSVRLFEHEFLDVRRSPDFVQIEMVWSSTQPLSPELQQRYTATNSAMWALGSWNHTFGGAAGASPLVFKIDPEASQKSRLGIDMGLSIETFAPTPGMAIEQDFMEFITVFYGYEPPEEWLFSRDAQVPPP